MQIKSLSQFLPFKFSQKGSKKSSNLKLQNLLPSLNGVLSILINIKFNFFSLHSHKYISNSFTTNALFSDLEGKTLCSQATIGCNAIDPIFVLLCTCSIIRRCKCSRSAELDRQTGSTKTKLLQKKLTGSLHKRLGKETNEQLLWKEQK